MVHVQPANGANLDKGSLYKCPILHILCSARGILVHFQSTNGAYTKTRAVCHDQNSSLLLQGRYSEASPLGDKVVIKNLHISFLTLMINSD